MDPDIIAALAGLAGIIVGVASSGRRHRSTLRTIEQRVDLLAEQTGVGEAFAPPSTTVEQLAARGEKIQAIRAYREENPGVGLKEAKERVDAIGSAYGRVADGDPDRILRTLDGVLRAFDLDPAAAEPAIHDDVVALMRAGRKIEAIKRLRALHPGMSLAEAKARVEQI